MSFELKLFRVIIPVSDVNKAAKFYSSIFGVPGKRVSKGRHYFNMSGVTFACYDPVADGDGEGIGPNPDHVYISVEEFDDLYNKVKSAQASYVSEIIDQSWGERIFYFNDPFGNKLGIVKKGTEFTG
ncbi:MAG: VOC family protein [Bacteroidetes bacterium]|nr:VOC family protein [Bacteroidota bacterium]MDA1121410.1 VOC family protein [Bacteroidota bacterium]